MSDTYYARYLAKKRFGPYQRSSFPDGGPRLDPKQTPVIVVLVVVAAVVFILAMDMAAAIAQSQDLAHQIRRLNIVDQKFVLLDDGAFETGWRSLVGHITVFLGFLSSAFLFVYASYLLFKAQIPRDQVDQRDQV